MFGSGRKEILEPNMRVKIKDARMYFIFLAFWEPALFMQISAVDNLYLVLKVLAGLVVIKDVFIQSRVRLNVAQVLSMSFFLSFVATTIINGGEAFESVKTIAFNALSCVYLIYMLKQDGKNTIRILSSVSIAYMTINLGLLLLFPNGFGAYIPGYKITVDTRLNFVGRDNSFIYFFLFSIVAILLDECSRKRKTYAIVIMAITMVYVWSGTGIVGCGLLLLYIVLARGKKIDRIFKWQILLPLNAALFFAIVIFNFQDKLSYLIVDILGKDVTFTGRTTLWESAIYYISRQPLFGYGITEKFLVAESGIAYSPHDLFLQILLSGGLFSFAIFLLYYLISVSKLDYKRYKSANMISVAIFIYFVVSLTESTMNTQFLYWLFGLAYCIEDFDYCMETREKNECLKLL